MKQVFNPELCKCDQLPQVNFDGNCRYCDSLPEHVHDEHWQKRMAEQEAEQNKPNYCPECGVANCGNVDHERWLKSVKIMHFAGTGA